MFYIFFSSRIISPLCLVLSVAFASLTFAEDVVVISSKLLDRIDAKYGAEAKNRIVQWQNLMKKQSALEKTESEKLGRANQFFNKVRWLSDEDHWGVEDYWATPIETLATNGGDCEDYSIGKYFTLLQSQVSNEKIRITYVKSLTYNQAHMVLAYYPTPGAEPLILDNINGEILPASERADLLPIYSFNGESIWLARNRGERLKVQSKTSLPQWKSVNERFLRELRGQ